MKRCQEGGDFPIIPAIYDEPLNDAGSKTSQMHGGQNAVEVTGSLISSKLFLPFYWIVGTDEKDKFYSLTGKILDRIFSSPDEREFPFDLSREGTEIIKQKNSASFILGRSGTGKTTCLLFKLLCRNIA